METLFLLLWLFSLQFLSLDFSLITFFQSSFLFLSVASRTWNCIIFYPYWFYPYTGWAFSGLLTDEGGQKGCPFLRSVTHILQWSNLAQLYLTKRRSKKYMNHVTHPLSLLASAFFLPEISKFCYIKKCIYRLHFDT